MQIVREYEIAISNFEPSEKLFFLEKSLKIFSEISQYFFHFLIKNEINVKEHDEYVSKFQADVAKKRLGFAILNFKKGQFSR